MESMVFENSITTSHQVGDVSLAPVPHSGVNGAKLGSLGHKTPSLVSLSASQPTSDEWTATKEMQDLSVD